MEADAEAGDPATDKRRGSLDPLSAAISVGAAGDAACDRTVPSNDGKRRIDIILKKVGTESPQAAGVPEAKGDLLVCEIYTKRVAGEFDDAPQEAETDRERPMRVWLARMDETPAALSGQARGEDLLRHHPRPPALLPRHDAVASAAESTGVQPRVDSQAFGVSAFSAGSPRILPTPGPP